MVTNASKSKSCLFDGCGRPNFAHGYCSSHAAQIRRGVELRAIRPPRPEAAAGFAWCSTCKQFLDEEFFSPDNARGGLQRVCRPCNAEKQMVYNRANRERITRQVTLARWGITDEQYQRLIDAQVGVCVGCKRPPNGRALCLDHDHETGQVRGLLCNDCNLGLGQFRDDPALLRRMADYIEAGGSLPAELVFFVDPLTHGARRTDIRRRGRLTRKEVLT